MNFSSKGSNVITDVMPAATLFDTSSWVTKMKMPMAAIPMSSGVRKSYLPVLGVTMVMGQ